MILAPALTLSAGSGAAIVRPTFSRDFAGEKTLNNGTGPAITFTRASNATFFDANGTLQTAANDTPRFDHSGGSSLGLLVEEARTNSIRNSQAGGSTNGVIGSGGAYPTNWATINSFQGLSPEIVGTGSENGFSYIDIRISGTSTGSSAFPVARCESNALIAASSGQSWTGSLYARLVSGSVSSITALRVVTAGTNGSSETENAVAEMRDTITSTLTRFSATRTLNSGSTTHVTLRLDFSYANAQTIDFTLRIAAPQLEQGAFPTSYIPTTSAAATRAADSAVVTPISSFYDQSQGTVVMECSVLGLLAGGVPSGIWNFALQSSITEVFLRLRQATVLSGADYEFRTGGVTSVDTISIGINAGQTYKFGSAFSSNDFAAYTDGAGLLTDSSVVLPTVDWLGFYQIASTGTSGHIRKFAYWPRRLSNTLLQQLTT